MTGLRRPLPSAEPAAPALDGLSAQDIALRLRALGPSPAPAQELAGAAQDEARPAAVLIPLFRTGRGWRLIYIRRAEQGGDRHSGEVAFPGGRCERGDADRARTALREAEEEIGLDPRGVRLLGSLRPLRTVSNFLVTPVVGLVPRPLALRPDPTEVARVFSIPLAWLEDPANRRVRPWPGPDHPQVRQVVFFEEFEGERLWGVSARITLDFIDRLRGTAHAPGR
jgi:8-oxo-dGTP pyrophosphatase MutT (NUDIX family)